MYNRAYTMRGNTDGLALSVPRDTTNIPLSTRDLLDEYADDFGSEWPKNASLARWAQNGVLLWNVVAAHSDKIDSNGADLAWLILAKEILETAWLHDKRIAFILWDPLPAILDKVLPKDALVFRTPGPGLEGFWGSHPFSRINDMRQSVHASPIDWRLR